MSKGNSALAFADLIDAIINRVGIVASWSYVVLIVVIIAQVILRYGFNNGLVVLEELQWHLYALGLMLGVAYGQTHNVHIRVDVLHARFKTTTKRIIEILGVLFLLMPFILVVIWHSFDFVADSWRINEHSNAPSGLPWRWAVKSVIPLSFGLLFLSATARLVREITLLAGRNT